MNQKQIIGSVAVLLLALSVNGRADFKSDLNDAAAPLQSATPKAGDLLIQGQFDAAGELLLQAFPKAQRTPAQTFALANTFFFVDPAHSYDLH